ncbi:MAG: DUF2267 domain-containing protein [Chloroflexota bacterium]|nr:MAG: DUF2267 domain-containing protein [Chloroflexota bacterium]
MDLDSYYTHILQVGKLRTEQHARRWSDGVLRTFGTALNRKTKRDLAKALPDDLARSLKDVFWLLHFRDPNLSSEEFLQRAARRSGNSNGEFAVYPTMAVFSGVRMIIDQELQSQVANSLSPQVRDLWEQAGQFSFLTDEAT